MTKPMPARARRISPRTLLAFTLLLPILALSAAGCSRDWKKKFIRKRKNPQVAQPILILQPDHLAVMPAADRYREHFAFWKSLHGDLLSSFGQLKKRDLVYLSGAIGELRAMQALLTGEPADRLKELLVGLDEMEERWNRSPTASHPASDWTTLEQVQRKVSKTFHYSNIKQTMVPDPERQAAQAEAPPAGAGK